MANIQRHRGPDAEGVWSSPGGACGLAHRRLSILDLSDAGRQPMSSPDGRYHLVFNGEIYNYVELRAELGGADAFRTGTDTEVLLAAFTRWGEACLDRLIGMFAFAIWDERKQRLFAARDRLGVKPLHMHVTTDGGIWLASEIKALHAAGVARELDEATWATYLVSGMYDHDEHTFWKDIRRLPPGHLLTWSESDGLRIREWYDPAEAALAAGPDTREEAVTAEELLTLLDESVRLRFRSDVPVGVCLSGGLDSSLLLGLVHRLQGPSSNVQTFTFYCGDERYDETPWVDRMLEDTEHRAHFCRLTAQEVPRLAERVMASQDEPFGGIPTLACAKVHERAQDNGVVVLLDGNGMDEAWGGYDYYGRAESVDTTLAPVQGSRSEATRPDCLTPEFAALARTPRFNQPFGTPLQNLQYRDLRHAKIPRAMRFADRVSMMLSRELREPFLDHRIVELGLRQKQDRKRRNGTGKWLVREVANAILPSKIVEAPKRPVQTPQREWLTGELHEWTASRIDSLPFSSAGAWFDVKTLRAVFRQFQDRPIDNSNPLWQWISLAQVVNGIAV